MLQPSGLIFSFIHYLSETRDREAAKTFLQKALSNPDNRTPQVCMDRCRIYPAAIRDLRAEGRLPQRCRRRTKRYANNRIESDHRHIKRRLPTDDADGASTNSCTHDAEGPIVGSQRMNPATASIAFSFLLKSSNPVRIGLKHFLHFWSGLQHFPTTSKASPYTEALPTQTEYPRKLRHHLRHIARFISY